MFQAWRRAGWAERAQVVEAEDVVGVGVGVEDGIDAFESGLQCLGAEVRAGIDNHDAFAEFR